MLRKTAWKRVPNSWGSKMNWAFTGWLKVNPGNSEQFFRRWAKNTRWLINMQNRGQIWRKTTLEVTESQNSQFVLNTKFKRQPVKLSEDGCNILVLSLFSDETGGTVLNSLKTVYLIKSDTSQCWITKIKTRGNNRINKTSSRFFSQGRMEPIRLKDKYEERHTSLMWSDIDNVWSILTPKYLTDFWSEMSVSRILMASQSNCSTREAVPTIKTSVLSALSMSLLRSIQHEIALIHSWMDNLAHSKSSTNQLLDNSVSSAYLWNEQLC